jgi:KipI family sensor histidine kinase inhibitor
MLTQDLLGAGDSASRPLACDDRAAGGLDPDVGGASLAYADPASSFDASNAAGKSTFLKRDPIDPEAPPQYRLWPAGDTALVVEFGSRIDRRLSAQVLALARRLGELRLEGIIEIVPTFRSLMVHYDPLVLSAAALRTHIDAMIAGMRVAESCGRHWSLPVCYDISLAPDLNEVAARTGLSNDEIIERHSGVTYYVYMLGFLPGMAYLGDVPPELALPRRATPRLKIPAGSLAIANTMTSILPRETPSGWHVIGRSPMALFEVAPTPKALLAPGDTVVFRPISIVEFEHLCAKVVANDLQIAPSRRPIGATA